MEEWEKIRRTYFRKLHHGIGCLMNMLDVPAEILIVEDPAGPLTALARSRTEEERYAVKTASNPTEALKLLRQRRPDLILLDLTILGEFGIGLLKRIRSEHEQALIILINDKASQEDKVRGFEAGADDYLVKPLSVREVVARTNARLKRRNAPPVNRTKIVEVGDLSIDVKNYRVYAKGEPLELKRKEFQVLAALATHPGKLRLRDELLEEIWGEEVTAGSGRALDVHIARLRRTLEKKSDYEYIHTTRKLGYSFEVRRNLPDD
jgi:DNA-binding response OmpR family regulator